MKWRRLVTTALAATLAGGCGPSSSSDDGGTPSGGDIAPMGDTAGADTTGGADGATSEDGKTPPDIAGGGDTAADTGGSTPGDDVGGDDGGGGQPDSTTGAETIVINEVVPNPVAPAVDWIELFNPGTEPADISGWKLTDDDPLHAYALPAGTVVAPGEYLLLSKDEPGSFDFGLGVDDAVFLYSPSSELIDFADWGEGDAIEGTSWGRFPNGVGPFGTLLTPTPAAANIQTDQPKCGNQSKEFGEVCDGSDLGGATCEALGYVGGVLTCTTDCGAIVTEGCELAPGEIVINEVVSSGGVDWIELENVGAQKVDVGGWAITDSDPLHVMTIELTTTIEPGAFLLLTQNEPGSFTFGLGDVDGVSLYNAKGELTDTTDWASGQAPAGASWGRMPDGDGPFSTLYVPTPGATNLENVPPKCGNDAAEFGELCDGSDVGEATCESIGFDGGTLVCNGSCDGYDTTACTLPKSGVVINEVTSAGDDLIELYNGGTAVADLSGWQVTDDAPEQPDHSYSLPGGTTLAPGAYLVLTKGVDHLFGLGGSDSVRLVDLDGKQQNTATWSSGEADTSFCRIPNGTGAFKVCTVATFGSANIP